MLVTTPTGPPFQIDRTKSGRVRVARHLGESATFIMLKAHEAKAVAAAILRLLESQQMAATSVRCEVGPPVLVQRQNGGLRISRQFQDGEEWLSMADPVAADVGLALIDVAAGVGW